MNDFVPEKTPHVDAQTVYEKLFEFSPDATIVSDHEGRIKIVNSQVESFFGYNPAGAARKGNRTAWGRANHSGQRPSDRCNQPRSRKDGCRKTIPE